tara:strand:+ start:559 stop:672 length:114 start_codon:yes stop_codon:yes gene_type:complete
LNLDEGQKVISKDNFCGEAGWEIRQVGGGFEINNQTF